MRPFLLLVLATSSVATAQETDRRPLNSDLEGAWEMVSFSAPEGGIQFDTVRLSIEGNWVTQEATYESGGEQRELSFTVECFTAESRPVAGSLAWTVFEDVINCLPSEDGTAGYGGLGQSRVEGDVLTLTMPDAGAGEIRVVLHRIE